MTTRMLIDARHREETRVAVVKGNRIEEFDFESAERKQLKGNIYLAKVTRVEPSLQAAFIDYGGNRHGFLAFSEIHPDYYQIPKEDREALLREEAEHAAEEAALRAEQDDDEEDLRTGDEQDADDDHADAHDEEAGESDDEDEPEELNAEDDAPAPESRRGRRGKRSQADEAVDALRERRMNLRRRYKIQDVIHRRQVLLVQVVKEERGNKGAALTTYLSLAGRYCVLMPNTSHGGGISRKISSAADRKRLKSIMADMALPPSMGCIVRTAGLQRTKTEIKRDFDYLARLWDEIREKTLGSSAPALVYGDSDLMKRAIRDIYNKDIDEVIVEGEEGYRQAKDFMRLLMPSHARKVKHYSDPVPLYQRAHVEDQLAAMYHPVVQLKSGGYLVINPTEALVSIDINSGRSTREHNIEQTATATNLEAAQEIGRQLRLRDMAGLVVIDFIDMDNNSNVRKVEKAMKEALKNDRARIQVGRISSFGLMEMSRQRLRTGVLEASTRGCPHCEGTGLVRTASSAGLSALRLIEDEAARGRGSCLLLRASQEAAFYVLNKKRADIAEIEDRYGVMVEVAADDEIEGARMSVDVSGPPPSHPPRFDAPIEDLDDDLPEEIEEEEELEVEEEPRAAAERPERAPREGETESEADSRRRRRRRRGRRGRARPEDEQGAGEGGDEAADGYAEDEAVGDAEPVAEAAEEMPVEGEAGVEGDGEGRRRRGRRGRRGGRRPIGEESAGAEPGEFVGEPPAEDMPELQEGDAPIAEPKPEPEPELDLAEEAGAPAALEPVDGPKRPRRRPRASVPVIAAPLDGPVAGSAEEASEPPARKPRRSRRSAAEPVADAARMPEDEAAPSEPAESEEAPAARRRAPRRKAADAPVEATAEVIAGEDTVARLADDDAVPADAAPAIDEPDDGEPATPGEPRRGWWQRTFGA